MFHKEINNREEVLALPDSGGELPPNVSTDQIESESIANGLTGGDKKIEYYTTKAGIPNSMAMSQRNTIS